MKRRTFLELASSLLTGASIIKVPDLGPCVEMPDAVKTGFLDVKNLDRVTLVHSHSRLYVESGLPIGWALVDKNDPTKVTSLGRKFDARILDQKPTAICVDEPGSCVHHYEPGSAMFDYAIKKSMERKQFDFPYYNYGASILLHIDGIGPAVHHAVSHLGRAKVWMPVTGMIGNRAEFLSVEWHHNSTTRQWSWMEPFVRRIKS